MTTSTPRENRIVAFNIVRNQLDRLHNADAAEITRAVLKSANADATQTLDEVNNQLWRTADEVDNLVHELFQILNAKRREEGLL